MARHSLAALTLALASLVVAGCSSTPNRAASSNRSAIPDRSHETCHQNYCALGTRPTGWHNGTCSRDCPFSLAQISNTTTQTGGGTIGSIPITGESVKGKNPRSLLCRTVNRYDLGLHNQESNLQKAKSGNWKAYQAFMIAFENLQSRTAQAVSKVRRGVPANVRTAAHQEVKNVMVLDKLILKSKNMTALDASMNAKATGAGSLTAETTVFYYVGGQCGLTGGESRSITGTTGIERLLAPPAARP